jgi:hypothetical protein
VWQDILKKVVGRNRKIIELWIMEAGGEGSNIEYEDYDYLMNNWDNILTDDDIEDLLISNTEFDEIVDSVLPTYKASKFREEANFDKYIKDMGYAKLRSSNRKKEKKAKDKKEWIEANPEKVKQQYEQHLRNQMNNKRRGRY